jgi:hypothetical protein
VIECVWNLSGAKLDYAVAKADNMDAYICPESGKCQIYEGKDIHGDSNDWFYSPTTDAEAALMIIEQEKINVQWNSVSNCWFGIAFSYGDGEGGQTHKLIGHQCADDPLTAAMRCFVEIKLGKQVEVPA